MYCILVRVTHHLVHHFNGHQITTIVSHHQLLSNDPITHNRLELVALIFKFHCLFFSCILSEYSLMCVSQSVSQPLIYLTMPRSLFFYLGLCTFLCLNFFNVFSSMSINYLPFYVHSIYSCVQVVAKSNYTDPIMSSSLQSIPNGISLYHSTTSGSSNINQLNRNRFQGVNSQQSTPQPYSLYETKSSTNINQKSLSPIMRGGDASLSSRELSSNTGYLKSASPPTTLNNNSYQNAIYVQKQQFYNNVNKFARDNAPSATANLSRSGGLLDSQYGTITNQPLSQLHNKSVHHNILTSSDTNLSKLFDRVHSSDESVCSSSSRDLNLSSQPPQQQISSQHHPLYGTRELNKSASGSNKQLNIWSDFPRPPNQQTQQSQQPSQQIYNDVTSHSNNNGSGHIPKKQERGHKDEIVKAKPYNIQQNWYVEIICQEKKYFFLQLLYLFGHFCALFFYFDIVKMCAQEIRQLFY